tara:strand:+ start:430 stop:711 length:282 start_codon:yes stop_codon:yes gene_type:complete
MSTLTSHSKVEIALAITLCSVVIGGVMWIQGRLNSVALALQDMRNEQARMGEELGRLVDDRWTITQMENWALRLKLQNQNLDVPSAKHEGVVR